MTGENDIGSTVEMSQELNKIIINSQLKDHQRWQTSLWY